MQTRREFLMTSAMCAIAVAAVEDVSAADQQDKQDCPSSTLMYSGDPYTAHVEECGLGGRSFDAARDHALRFRTSDLDRDRLVLGLDI